MVLAAALALGALTGGAEAAPSGGQTATLEGRVLSAKGTPVANAVVFLTGPQGGRAPAGKPVLDQRGRTFIPHVMAVPVGTTVEFPNHDTVFHNVFSVREGKRFDLGLYPTGSRRDVKFDHPGLVRIFCNIHSEMSAFIWVLPNPYFSVTDRKGAYRIAGAPPGTHRLTAWAEPATTVESSVTLSAGTTAHHDLALPPR